MARLFDLIRCFFHTRAQPRRHTRLRRFAVLFVAVPALLFAGISPAAALQEPEPEVGTLVAVRAAHHPGFDRVVWQFDGPLPRVRMFEWVDRLNNGASDDYMPVAGNAILRLTMYNARAHHQTDDGWIPTLPRRQSFGLNNVTELVQNDDWEAVVGYGIGLNKKQPFTTFTLSNPNRIVADIRTGYRTINGSAVFLNQTNYQNGTEPLRVARARPLVSTAPAAAAMNHLYAGPTASEYAAGLRLVKSGTMGWKNLSITNGVARVTLTGGCNSGGASFTVADLITPTLKQFSSVRYVKIYNPRGSTQRPTGNSDSIPTCLEP